MDIAIIGASGTIGRTVVNMIAAEGILSCDQRLILVGHAHSSSSRSLPGLAVDLADAYDETCPAVEVITEPGEIPGDVIIMAAGATLNAPQEGARSTRDDLAEANLPIFDAYARRIADHGHGSEIVICISNPNELAVAVFARHLGRDRVIGMGAFLDSLRFRKEIAHDLGVRRQRVHAFMVGEHGAGMVPLWSNVHVYGLRGAEHESTVASLRGGHRAGAYPQELARVRTKLLELLSDQRVQSAYAYVDRFPADIRAALKPFVTHFSLSLIHI